MPDRRIEWQQHFRLRRALSPRLPLAEREESGSNGVPEATRTEMHTDPELAALIDKNIDVVVARADRAELFTGLLAQALTLRGWHCFPCHRIEQRVIDRCIIGQVLTTDTETH